MFPFPAFLPSALGNRHSAIRLSVKNSCNPCLPSDFGLRISFGLRPSDFRSHRPSPIRPFDVGCWMLDVPLPPLPPIGNPAIRLSSQSQRDCIPKPSAPRATLGHILQNAPNPERVASTSHPASPSNRLSAIGYRLSAIGNPAIGNRQSAIGNRLSAIGNRLSAIGYRLSRPSDFLRISAFGFRISGPVPSIAPIVSANSVNPHGFCRFRRMTSRTWSNNLSLRLGTIKAGPDPARSFQPDPRRA